MLLWTRRSRPNDHEPLTNNGWKAAFSWAFSLHPDLSSRSDRQTNQGTIQCPVLTVRSMPLCQMPSDCVLLSQHVSLPLHLPSPHDQTNWEALQGERIWVFPRNAGRENHNLSAFIPGDISNKKKKANKVRKQSETRHYLALTVKHLYSQTIQQSEQ